MGRGIGAMVITQLAVITFFFHLFEVGGLEFGEVAFMFINTIEEGVKRGTEVETSAASIADIVDSNGFPVELFAIPTGGDKRKTLH